MKQIKQILLQRRNEAVVAVREALRKDPFYEEMSPVELEIRKPCNEGWFTSEPISGIDRRLEIFLPSNFPDVPPLIKLSGKALDLFLNNPHVFKDGSICVLANSASVDADKPVEVVQYCIRQSIEILTQNHSEDFRDEFSVYWNLDSGGDSKRFILVEPLTILGSDCCSELLDNYVVIGSSEHAITRWVSSFLGKQTHTGTIRPCIIVELNKPLLPSQYPNSIWDVREIVKCESPASLDSLDKLICDSTRFFTILFKQNGDGGSVLAGVVAIGQGLKKIKKIAGFRSGKAPKNLLITSGKTDLKKNVVDRGTVQRVDHNWIHTRGGDGADLATKKILIIGCGSLGGYVAHLLARAGVGELMLLDNDKFEWENVGRHVLGASQIGLSKADALRKKIQQELPHLCVNHFFGDWRNWIDQGNTENFDSFDLVISTVGDWSCERPLNILRKRKNSPPLLFGWIEAYGVAGHALLAGQSGGCMECGVNQYGHFSNKVAAFEKGTLTKEPGGCTYYQEYGPLSVTPIAEMVSRLSIDVMRGHSNSSELRSWIGPISEIINHGGVISEFWENKVSNDSLSQTLGMSWINRENCNVCS